MYEPHETFDTPEDSVALWRYLDLAKFLDLLVGRRLYFSRVQYLGDPFEGSFTRQFFEARRRAVARGITEVLPTMEARERAGGADEVDLVWLRAIRAGRDPLTGAYLALLASHAGCCWHEGTRESAAMWAQFGRGGGGGRQDDDWSHQGRRE